MTPTSIAAALQGFPGTILRTILVVEDEESIRETTAEFLRDCNYIVLEAGDVAEARDLLLDWHVDLVFSDINMPNHETGFALEKWIRHHHPDMKVILTSGCPQATADTRGLCEPLIPKPYSQASLVRRIDHALQPDKHWPAP